MRNTYAIKKGRALKRFFFIFILFVSLSLFSYPISSQNVTLKVKDESIEKVLNQLKKQTGLNFFYSRAVLTNIPNVTLDVQQTNLQKVLDELSIQTDLSFQRDHKTISVRKKNTNNESSKPVSRHHSKIVKGQIVDSKGDPIIGASVIVKGSSNGTATDLNGIYTLSDVPDDGSLVISYIGYRTVNVKASAVSSRIMMEEDTKVLSEVVVTALGIKREEKALGYAVQKIDGDALSIVKGTDVATSLTGKIAGLAINNSSEISEKPELKLRGEDPLIVIDGVAYGNMSLSDVSAEDIESLDVLKGATASALYGVRGRAGAVMITTKKSGKEGTLTVNVSNNTMFSIGYLKMPKVQSSYSTGSYGQLEYGSGYVWGDYMDGHEVDQYDPITMTIKKMPLVSKGRDNVQNFLRNSMVTNTNVNIAQAGKLGGFRFSATQVHYDGQYPSTSLDKYIVNGSGNIKYNKFNLDASFSFKKEKAPNMPTVNYGQGNILYDLLIWGGTEFDIRDFKNYWKIKDRQQNWAFENWYDNPYYIVNECKNSNDDNLFTASLTMSYDIMKNMKIMFRSGYDNYSNNEEQRRPIGDSSYKQGYFYYGDSDGSSFNNDLIVNGNFNWKDFRIDALAGLSSYWYQTKNFYSYTRGGLSVPGFYSLNASVERPGVSKSESEKALYSIYGKLGMSWKNAIYIDVTGRNDWSSTLPSNSRSYFYPSVSGSFIPSVFYNPFEGVLDFWKIRASWTVAKKDLNVYDLNSVYSIATDVWEGYSTANYPSKLRDPNCKPETENSYEIGTNFRLFKGRLAFDYTYFTRLRSNRIIEAPVSNASGFTTVNTNTRENLRQKGMELTITAKPVVSKDFSWEAAFNISYWHWYYAKLDPLYSSQDPRIGKGERCDKFFIYDWEHDHNGNMVYQAGLPIKNKYQTVMGYRDPKCYLGWSNKFTYKNFDLNISIDGRIGGLMYSWTEQAMWNSGTHPKSDNKWRYDEVVNHKSNYVAQGMKVMSGSYTCNPYGKVIEDTRTFASNDVPVSYQNFIQTYNQNAWDHQARQNIKNATFIKLREIALNYTLPISMARKIMMKSVRFGVIGQNLLMWTKEFRYSDPDRGQENMNTPTSRFFGFNINLTL